MEDDPGVRMSGTFEEDGDQFRVSLAPVKPRKPREPKAEPRGPYSPWSIPWPAAIDEAVTLPPQAEPYHLDRVCVSLDSGGPAVSLKLTVIDGAGNPSCRAWTAETLGSGTDTTLTLAPDLALAVSPDSADAVGPIPPGLVILPGMTVEISLVTGPFPGGTVHSCTAFTSRLTKP